jgi:hypothetical protein
MTIVNTGNGIYAGLSTDTKAITGIPNGSRFIETDTGNTFTWNGIIWFPHLLDTGKSVGARIGFGAASTGNGIGMFQTTVQGGGAATASSNTTSADGNCVTHTTGTANTKARAGWWSNALCQVMRKFNPLYMIRFRLGQAQTSNQGIFYVGLQSLNAQPTTATSVLDTYLDTKIGVLFGFRSSDSVFKILSNNAQTLATYTTAGTPNSSATDTTVHTLIIQITDSPAQINWWYDGTAMTSITDTTNSVPPQTTVLYPILILEAQTATGLTLIERWTKIYMDAI